MSASPPASAGISPLEEARNPQTNPERLRALATMRGGVANAVAANPNTPTNILLWLAGRCWESFLANPVLPLLLLEDPGLPARLPLRALRRLVRQADAPPLFLKALAHHPDAEIRAAAGLHIASRTAAESESAAEDWHERLRAALHDLKPARGMLNELLTHQAVPDWLFEVLGGAKNPRMRAAVAQAAERSDSPRARQVAKWLEKLGDGWESGQVTYSFGTFPRRWRKKPDPSLSAEELDGLAALGPGWQRLVARHPNSSPATIARLALGSDRDARRAAVRHPALPPHAALTLSAVGDLAERRTLARKKTTPPQALEHFARDADATLRKFAAANRQTPSAALARLAADLEAGVRAAAAANSGTPAANLIALAGDASADVRLAVAKNARSPLEAIVRAAADADAKVREAVTNRADATPEVLMQLMRDRNSHVRMWASHHRSVPKHVQEFVEQFANVAEMEVPPLPEWGDAKGWRQQPRRWPRTPRTFRGLINKIYQDFGKHTAEFDSHAAHQCPNVRLAVAHKTTTPDLLGRMAADPEAPIRSTVARNPSTTQTVLMRLAADSAAEVREAVAKAKHAPPELILALSHDADSAVRATAARHPELPVAELPRLAADGDEHVRAAVAGRDDAPVELLEALATDAAWQVQAALQRNARTPAGLLRQWWQSDRPDIRHRLIANKGLPADLLAQLTHDSRPAMQQALAQHPAATPEMLRRIATTTDEHTLWFIVKHPAAPPDLLVEVCARGPVSLASFLPESPQLTPELLEQVLAAVTPEFAQRLAYAHRAPGWFRERLARSEQVEVRSAIAGSFQEDTESFALLVEQPLTEKGKSDHVGWSLSQNQKTPPAVLDRLFDTRKDTGYDGPPHWFDRIAAHPNATPELLRKFVETYKPDTPRRRRWQRHDEVWVALVRNPRTPSDVLARFANHSSREVREALLARSDCPAEIRPLMRAAALSRNLRHGNVLGRVCALSNPTTPPDALRAALKDARWIERYAMTQHPAVPRDLLNELSRDANRIVRAAAAERLAQDSSRGT